MAEYIARDSVTGVLQIIQDEMQEAFGEEENDDYDLHKVVLFGSSLALRFILSKEDFQREINVVNMNGHTPLMLAVVANRLDLLQCLTEVEGCDVNEVGEHQDTVLHFEAEKDSATADVAALLIKHGADIEARNIYGMTPFRKAVEFHNMTVARVLVSAGCDINAACTMQGSSPLHAAIQIGDSEFVHWLIKIGGEVNARDKHSKTPLMCCVEQRRDPHQVFLMMQYLLEAGCLLNCQDVHSNTALLLALSNPVGIRKRHIELLIAAGADANLCNVDGLTPLWQAVYTGTYNFERMDIVQLLVQENCYLDKACRGKLLFRCGPDAVYCYETYMTPLEVAMDSGLYEVAKMLVLAGCLVKPDMRCEMPVTDTPSNLVWFRDVLETPQALQHQCRLFLRRFFGKSVQSKVPRLPLPEKVKSYILLEDVFEEFYFRK